LPGVYPREELGTVQGAARHQCGRGHSSTSLIASYVPDSAS
jgi:hypothetical protein